MLTLIGPLGDHHRTVTNTRHPQQGVLDLAQLDPETADLQLRIPAAQELQLPVRPPPAMITTAIPTLARSGSVRNAARVRSGSLM